MSEDSEHEEPGAPDLLNGPTPRPSSPRIGGSVLALVIALMLAVTAACGDGSTNTATPTSVAEPTPTPTSTDDSDADTTPSEPAETPTEQPVEEEVDDEAFETAAIAALETDPPADLFAWDVLNAELQGTGDVVLVNLCGWDGNSVDDEVLQATYRVNTDDAGETTATLESINPTDGDCNNTELVESVFNFVAEYENFWSGVLEDPSSYTADAATKFWVKDLIDINEPFVDELDADGLAYRNLYFDSRLPKSAVTEVLIRSYKEPEPVLELFSCRALSPDYGIYRDDVLVDNFRSDNAKGGHVTVQYLATRHDESWWLLGAIVRPWSDCFGFADGWLDGVNALLGEPVPWQQVNS